MSKRVLSIQSHVVFGYVGNKSATFPLQTLGYDVDCLNTVQFSNHGGYSKIVGPRFSGKEIFEIFEGLSNIGVIDYSHILTGYLGKPDLITSVKEIVLKIKQRNPKVFYVLDPVMGDNGTLYVSPEMIPLYKDQLLPLANLLTPNQTEAEFLTDIKITDIDSLKLAFEKLHSFGIEHVVITSATLKLNSNSNQHYLYGSSKNNNQSITNPNSNPIQFSLAFPSINGNFGGTGDLFSALMLAWFNQSNLNLPSGVSSLAIACQISVATIQNVLINTINNPFISTSEKDKLNVKNELRLIQSKSYIENPDVIFIANPLP